MNILLALLLAVMAPSGPGNITAPVETIDGLSCTRISQTQTLYGLLEVYKCCSDSPSVCRNITRLTPWVDVPGRV